MVLNGAARYAHGRSRCQVGSYIIAKVARAEEKATLKGGWTHTDRKCRPPDVCAE